MTGILNLGLTAAVAAGLVTAAPYRVENFAGGGSGGDGGPALAARFSSLEGVAVGPDGVIYVADAAANRVRRIDGAGKIHAFASGVALRNPYGLAVDWIGNVYIADYGNGRVRKVAIDGTVSDVAVGLKGPRNVALSPSGGLYISDFDAGEVLERRVDGRLVPLEIGGLMSPAGLAVDAGGALYIADAAAGVVHRYAAGKSEAWMVKLDTPTGLAVMPNGTLLVTGAGFAFTLARTVAGTLLAAGPSARDLAPDGRGGVLMAAGAQLLRIKVSGATEVVAGTIEPPSVVREAREVTLDGPIGIAADALGNIYIAEERAGRIRRVDRAGIIHDVARVEDPVAVAPLTAGGLLVAEFAPGRIRSISPAGALATRLSAPVVTQPRGVAADALGNLYVADAGANRLLRVSASGGLTVAGEGFLVKPSAVAVEPSGAVLVADSGHHMVRRYEPWTGNWRTLAGQAVPGDGGDGGPASLAQLNFPAGLAAAANGAILIADTYNHRVRRIGIDGTIETIAQAPEIDTPSGVAIGPAGEIYVADLGHNRVVRLTPEIGPAPDVKPPETPPALGLEIRHAAAPWAQKLAPGQLFRISGVPLEGAELYLDGRQTAWAALDGSAGYAVTPAASSGFLKVEVRSKGRTTGRGEVAIAASAAALFTDDQGLVLAHDAFGRLEALPQSGLATVYGTGEGIAPESIRLVLKSAAGTADMGVLYAGSAPGQPGVLQINANVPRIAPGEYGLEVWVGETPGLPGARVLIQ
jgi:uncharacterized protein (TIGR03437 family)